MIKIYSNSKQNKRSYQEDAIAIDVGDVSIFSVFDGHGGGEVSAFLKKYFNSFILKTEHTGKLLSSRISIFDEMILNFCPHSGSAGSTLATLVIKPGSFTVGWMGDSRIIGLTKTDKINQLTQDHNASNPIEVSLLKKMGIKVTQFANDTKRVGDTLECTRTMGDFDQQNVLIKKPQVQTWDNNYKYVVLMSDGVYENMSNENIIKFISSASGDKAEKLIDHIIEKNLSNDNLSVIILEW